MCMRWLVIVVVMVSGCADPLGADETEAAEPVHESARGVQQSPDSDEGTGQAGSFEPVTVTWEGTTFLGACVFPGSGGTCAGSPLFDQANDFDVPAGASNVTVTFTWDDPADRELNVRVGGAVDEPIFVRGGSPLLLAAPLNGTELQISAAQYVANEAGLQVHSEVSFRAEITFS